MQRTEDVMGMPVTVDVRDADATSGAVDDVYADLVRIDQLFSPFLPQSEVSRIGDGRLAVERADPLVREVLELCRVFEGKTDGYFSAWYGGKLDPSGLVKGWAIARAATILDARGYRDYFIDAGGDVRTRGHSAPGTPWRVGIRHPVQRDKVARVILATDLAVATSGTYEKGAHILDPHTGAPAAGLLSMTVVGPSILEADVYATAAFVMGLAGLDFIERRAGYEAYAIDPDLRGHWTTGFDEHCEQRP
jgi:thiamine biosynthesis lipoprotein